jgi:hypothetical protein
VLSVLTAAIVALVPHGHAKLAWRPPALRHPLSVDVTLRNRVINLDPRRDYMVRMPRNPVRGAVSIIGGHNVVLIGGEVRIPPQGPHPSIDSRRGLLLKDQTGTVHVEGLLIDGRGLSEGIDLDQRRGATVQIENVRVIGIHALDERNFSDNHPDIIQTWAGPARLRVDRLTGSTDYQGFFLNPRQFGPKRAPRLFDFRHVNIEGLPTAHYLLWQDTSFPMHLSDVWISPARGRSGDHSLWPSPRPWHGVQFGQPGGGPFVPAGSVGTRYRSPGYAH